MVIISGCRSVEAGRDAPQLSSGSGRRGLTAVCREEFDSPPQSAEDAGLGQSWSTVRIRGANRLTVALEHFLHLVDTKTLVPFRKFR